MGADVQSAGPAQDGFRRWVVDFGDGNHDRESGAQKAADEFRGSIDGVVCASPHYNGASARSQN
jgi:hypothetical protein